jgi:hypothetical protein
LASRPSAEAWNLVVVGSRVLYYFQSSNIKAKLSSVVEEECEDFKGIKIIGHW